jgi:hypothetical protein
LTDRRPHRNRADGVAADLVEYIIVAVPNLESLSGLAPVLIELVDDAAIRILDLVVVVKDRDGTFAQLELDSVDAMRSLRTLGEDIGGMLSDHDIQLAASAVPAGSTGVVVVTEDRWAAPLSAAARLVGGQIIAGDRIPASRVATVLAERSAERGTGAHVTRSFDVT